MIYTLKNNFLTISIQHTGAEICSIKSNESGKEFMWNANPEIWGSFAPVLFPIVGALKNNSYTYKGVSYSLPKHGFIRNNNSLQLETIFSDTLVLKYEYNEETLKMYPFRFVFYISFHLDENKLTVSHKIENHGELEMLFSLGAHPGFKCPINTNEKCEDYYIEFEEKEIASTWELAEGGLTSGKKHLVLDNTEILPLTQSLFIKDALIFKELKSKKVSLKNHKNSNKITIHFSDFKYLGIWAKPGAPFVCIEPWLGIADDVNSTGQLENKEGILRLKSNSSFSAHYVIELENE